MKAYNTPNDTLTIKSDEGEELVSITPEGASIKNLDGSSFGFTAEDAGKILVVDSEGNLVPQEVFVAETTTEDLITFSTTTSPQALTDAVRAGKRIDARINVVGAGSYVTENIGVVYDEGNDIYTLRTSIEDGASLGINGLAVFSFYYWPQTPEIPFSVQMHTLPYASN